MLVLITYDVNTENAVGKRRLRQVAKQCVNFGQRVQIIWQNPHESLNPFWSVLENLLSPVVFFNPTRPKVWARK